MKTDRTLYIAAENQDDAHDLHAALHPCPHLACSAERCEYLDEERLEWLRAKASSDKAERIGDFRKTGRLSMKIMLSASLYRQDWEYLYGGPDGGAVEWMRGLDRAEQRVQIGRSLRAEEHYADDYAKISAAADAIHEAVKVWEQAIWFGGLQGYYRKSSERGHKAEVGDLEMLVWGCAGRVMVTMNRGDSSVTVICDETSPNPRSGLHGIDATEEAGLAILLDAASNPDELLRALRPDGKVGIGL